MTRLTGNHGRLLRKITASGLVPLLFVAGLPPTAAAAESCKDWKTQKFFETATVDEVSACLSAGEDPNEPDTQGRTALHRAARETRDPAVIEALLDAGANPRSISIAGRRPWDYARTNGKIKGSAAYQRLWIAGAKAAKKASWSRVQAVPRDTKTVVRLYQDAAPPPPPGKTGRSKAASNRPRPTPSPWCSRMGKRAPCRSRPCARCSPTARSANDGRDGSPWELASC